MISLPKVDAKIRLDWRKEEVMEALLRYNRLAEELGLPPIRLKELEE
jgi:hypothetical protein